jgi:hypothetical protein
MKPMNSSVTALEFDHYLREQFPDVEQLLLDVYSEVYSEELSGEFFSLDEFSGRLRGHASNPGWECVTGRLGNEVIGYVYGFTRGEGGGWTGLLTPVDPELTRETEGRTFALCEIMVRVPWRKTGAAHAIHEELLSNRRESRVHLLVDETHEKVRALYENWGYVHVAKQQTFSHGPTYDAMIRVLHSDDSSPSIRGI